MSLAQWIDAAVVVLYLVVSFVIGVKAARWMKTSDRTESDYFLAGRKIPGWLAGVSVGVTSMNADVAPAYAGVAVVVGLPVAWFYLSRFAFALMVIALLFAYKWRSLRVNTGPEFFALRFGGKGGRFVRVWSSLYGVMLGMVPWIGAGILGVHLIVGPIFGYDDVSITLAFLIPVLLLYVWKSGYSGVLLVDLFQAGVIVVANVALTVVVLMRYGGPSGLAEAIRGALPAESGEILSALPVPGHAVMGPMLVLAWLLLPTVGAGGNVQTDGQRLLSCANARESMKSYIWSAIVLFVMLLTLTLPVLGLLPIHPELYHAEPAAREAAYGMMLKEFFPSGLLGLALAAMAAAVMSTIASHLNFGAQTIVNDILKVFRPGITDERGILYGRLSMVAIMGASIAVVYNSTSLIGIAVTLLGLFAATASIAWGQWWWWRTNFPAWVSAMVVGPFIYFGLGYLLPEFTWWKDYAAQGETAKQALDLLKGAIGLVISLVTWVTVTLCTKPEDMETLKAFYKRARPMGAWGPVREAILRDEGPDALPAERPMLVRGLVLGLLGAAWISAAILALSKFYVGDWVEGIVYTILAAALAFGFAKAFDRYHAMLAEGTPAESGP
ncbi:sodium:solute symporter [bacterium]|nr:sodium:solute symporter [bacterium]